MLSLLGGLVLLASSFLLLKLCFFCRERSLLPPGPFPLPLLGNLWQLSFQLRPEMLFQLARTHGSMFTVWVGPTPVVVLSGFRAVKEALVSNSEQFSGRPLTPFFRDLFGERGIICTNGHTWRQQRRFCLMALRELGLGKQALEKQLQREAAELGEAFHQERGRPFNPRVLIVRATARVIGTLVFGRRFLFEEPIFQELTQAIDFGLAFVSTVWRRLYDIFPWALRHLSGPHQKVFQCHKAVRGFIRQEIIRHKLGTPEAPQDFIGCYLTQIAKATDSPLSTFSEENLIQVVVDLFLGGTDTTATTLHWALLYLVHHRAVQNRVQQELDEVLGAAQDISYEDRKRLPYTRAVLHEAQRLSSVVAVGAVRQCVTATRVHGYSVPKILSSCGGPRGSQLLFCRPVQWVLHMGDWDKGTIILPNLASVLCDPECWETPQQFNPGHFLDKDGNFKINEAFLPFSAGHRVCPGEQLARMELFLMFATLLRTFHFQLPEGSQGLRLEYVLGGTLQPQPQEICAVPRLSTPGPGAP